MDFFQEGLYNKGVSPAQVDNIIKFFDTGVQAVYAASAVDWKRSDINRMKVRLDRLKDELKYVLRQQEIPLDSVEIFRRIINDDAVPIDTVADTSDKTDYSKVRYHNFSMPTNNELSFLVISNSGPVMNRIMNLIMEINFTRVSIAKIEADLSSISSARKQFLEKKDNDKETFDRLRSMLSNLSEMSGYVEALNSLVESYPKASPTDVTIRGITSQFDQSCRMWRRYKSKLEKSIKEYRSKYADFIAKPIPSNFSSDFLSQASDNYEAIVSRMTTEFSLRYNKSTKKLESTLKTQDDLFKKIDDFISGGSLPDQYTGVPFMVDNTKIALEALVVALGVSRGFVENSLIEWSGGKALASNNPAIAKVIDKARQLVASPVVRTKIDPLTRDAYLNKSLIDFKAVNDTVKKIRHFLESSSDKITNAITRKLVDFDQEYLRKTFLRRSLPIPNSIGTMKPVEDAVRAKVRKRYGDNVPFEDEVNVGTEDAPVWRKESLALYDTTLGKWVDKTEASLKALDQTIKESDTSTNP